MPGPVPVVHWKRHLSCQAQREWRGWSGAPASARSVLAISIRRHDDECKKDSAPESAGDLTPAAIALKIPCLHLTSAEETTSLRSGRPIYAIVLLALSILFLCATFLPFLYSLLSPNPDVEQFVGALREGGTAPLEADTVVEQTRAALGSLNRTIQIAYYTETRMGFHLSGSQSAERIHVSQATYIAWFQKRPKPMLIAVTVYTNDAGQKAFGISDAAPLAVVRGYGVPILLFGVCLFLVRKRKPSGATA